MDPKHFAKLFVQYRPDFRRFAYWLTHDTDEADDLVQEAYCYGWQRLEDIPCDECRFVHWIFTGIRFLRKTRNRDRRLEGRLYQRFNSHVETALHSTRPDNEEALRPYRFMVFDAVRRLPKMYRAPLVMHEIMDFPCGELSAIEDVAEGTIKSRLYRGRKILKRSLAGIAHDEHIIRRARTAKAPAPGKRIKLLPKKNIS